MIAEVVTGHEVPGLKASFEVRIRERLTEVEIGEVAHTLRAKRRGYDRVFIEYTLPHQWGKGDGAWATSHWEGGRVSLKIWGLTVPEWDEAHELARKMAPGALGVWVMSGYAGGPIAIRKSDTGYVTEEVYMNDASRAVVTTAVVRSKHNGLVRFDDPENGHGEFYLINRASALEVHDGRGLILAASPAR